MPPEPGHEATLTDRLALRALAPGDVDEVFRLHADPAVWTHLPQGQYRDRDQAVRFVDQALASWRADGLGYWAVRVREDVPRGPAAGSFVGVAGVTRAAGPVWNLYYRFAPGAHGHGLAGEAAAAAVRAAGAVDPEVPVTAYLLEHNTASDRLAGRLGLQLVWRGPDRGNPDPAAVRLVYADRPLGRRLLDELTSR